ncbi:baseplate J/gp47 family protein [Burkholderia mayonis]|uniref:Phage tail protein n=1 Tax=Burkholderia mayonis TaxID=1385591 RepID=A0A1B4G3V2_9BURK|nr:baseplate J/gp47 family protein [Burkholderia mayonis]AOJ10608.1 phage tail protein [Burkholderia mayonis]KVE53201.1 phage tail protein [Burkholderia mayonis]
MPATVLTLDQIRENILREIKNQRSEADVGKDSDYYVRASGVASAIEGLYAHQVWTAKQIFPDTADEDKLILHARLRGIERKPAVVASGTARATGKPGVTAASGLSAKYQDGTGYVTTSGGTFDASGKLIVNVAAITAGVIGNRQKDDVLTLTVPPIDVDASLTIVSLRGGTAIETLDSLLARLLQRIRRPPAGGNKYDYWQWVMEVPGVTSAYIYPLRRGLGTVDVVIATDDGLPSDDVLMAAQAHIDDQRPVRAKDTRVVVPSIKTYDVTAAVKLDGISIEAAEIAVTNGLNAYNAIITPGETVIRNRVGGVINDTPGIVDYALDSPVGNVVPIADAKVIEWCRLGKVKLRPLV